MNLDDINASIRTATHSQKIDLKFTLSHGFQRLSKSGALGNMSGHIVIKIGTKICLKEILLFRKYCCFSRENYYKNIAKIFWCFQDIISGEVMAKKKICRNDQWH